MACAKPVLSLRIQVVSQTNMTSTFRMFSMGEKAVFVIWSKASSKKLVWAKLPVASMRSTETS
jgi:hypothetical protein